MQAIITKFIPCTNTNTPNASAAQSAQHNLPLSFVTTGQRVTYLRDVKLNAFATMTREDSPELAELICRAVNSHAELLAACKRALIEFGCDPVGLIEAISRAEGRS